jgi:hypothetical protein
MELPPWRRIFSLAYVQGLQQPNVEDRSENIDLERIPPVESNGLAILPFVLWLTPSGS